MKDGGKKEMWEGRCDVKKEEGRKKRTGGGREGRDGKEEKGEERREKQRREK